MCVCMCAVDVESSACLRALRWSVAGGLNEQLGRRARQSGEFLLSPEDRPCELHRTVSEFLTTDASGNNECAFKFVVRV